MRGLQKLDLSENRIGAEGARALAASENLRGLKELDLSDNDIGDEGARALAASESLRSVSVTI